MTRASGAGADGRRGGGASGARDGGASGRRGGGASSARGDAAAGAPDGVPERRLVFTRYPDRAHEDFSSWRSHLAQLTAYRGAVRAGRRRPDVLGRAYATSVDDVASPILWRVVSSRGAELAVSARCFPSLEEARRHATHVIAHVGELTALKIADGSGHHSWYLVLAGRPVLVAGRWFTSNWGRNNSLERMLATLGRLEGGALEEAVDPEPDDGASAEEGRPRPRRVVRMQAVLLADEPVELATARPIVEPPPPRPIRELLSRAYPRSTSTRASRASGSAQAVPEALEALGASGAREGREAPAVPDTRGTDDTRGEGDTRDVNAAGDIRDTGDIRDAGVVRDVDAADDTRDIRDARDACDTSDADGGRGAR